jgi:predicted RecB family nuclease
MPQTLENDSPVSDAKIPPGEPETVQALVQRELRQWKMNRIQLLLSEAAQLASEIGFEVRCKHCKRCDRCKSCPHRLKDK